MTEEEQSTNQQSNVEDELKSLKDEMRELKEMLQRKAKDEADQEEVNVGKGPSGFRFEFDSDDMKFEGVDETLESYLGSVMEGVASNLSNSMKQMAKGFQFDIDLSDPIRQAKRELERNKGHIEREMRRVERDVKRTERDVERAARNLKRKMKNKYTTVKFHKLSEEELNRFFELAPSLTSALSDEKKLKLLKALEDGPMYQKDLSESTSIAGGTFKHHMDSLLEVQYVQQEAVRGRYLITQLGIEALKLSEMLFRRYVFTTNENATEREEEIDVDFEEDIEDQVDTDISNDAEAVEDLQNEEEEG